MDYLNTLSYSAENVEKVLTEFYTTSHTNFKPQLDNWLKLAQNSPDAWNFSWYLLDTNKSPEIQFFGASSLYTKVSKYFNEVPVDQYDTLKNKVLEKLLFYSNVKQNLRLIQRKLNSILAKLALYLICNEWTNCIQDIIQTIPNLNTPELDKNQLKSIVVDILTLLPEEFSTLHLQKQRLSIIRNTLVNNFQHIKQFLQQLFSTPNPNECIHLIENGIKCLTSWNEIGVLFNEMDIFVQFLFVAIYNELLFEATCECLTSIFTLPDNSKYTQSMFQYMPSILNLNNLLNKFVDSKDTDGCVILTKLVLAYAECQLKIIFEITRFGDTQAKNLLFSFMNLIMSLSSIPGNFPVDEESTDLTFVFWYTFQDELQGIDETGELRLIYKQYFINLLEIFIQKLQLPDNYDSWSEDDKERLRCYRIDIGDTMVYMISIVGDIMIEYIIKRLVESVEKKLDWKVQESLIYMLQSVVSELNESTNPDYNVSNDAYLISFTNILPHVNYCNKHILSTTLMAVGSMGGWLERNPNVLPNIISLCLLGLKTESVTQSASFAIKDIINDCDLSSYADQIISTCQECLKLGTLVQNYEVRLMAIIGLSVSDLLCLDLQRAINWINVIITPYVYKLDELAKLQTVDKNSQALTCHILNLLSQLLSSLSVRQRHESVAPVETTNEEKTALKIIMVKLFPIYKLLVNRHLSIDLLIVDKVFESITVVLASSGGDGFEEYINDIIELMYGLDENCWRRYSYELCRQLLMIWWRNDKHKNVLHNLFLYCNQNAMKLLTKDLNWFHEHTDIVEQYCTCLAKLLKSKYYDLFNRLNRETLLYLIQFGQLGLQLPEQYTLRAVVTFMEEFTHFTKTEKHLVELMEQSLPSLIQTVLIGISGAIPRHLVDLLASILYTFFKDYMQQTNSIINSLFSKTDFPNLNATTQALTKEKKLSFLKLMITESNNKRRFKEVITEFSLTCRGLANTEYARETTNKY